MYVSIVRAGVVLSLFVGSALAAETGALPADTARDTLKTNSFTLQRCSVRISTLLVEDMKLDDTLDLIVETGGKEIGGCQFKLAVTGDIVHVLDILPGELIDSCRWEMFDARPVQPDAQGAPREVWQITALAQGVSNKTRPVCFGFNRPVSLARLVVSSAHRPPVADTTAEIFFYWESCRDNILSDREGASVLISDTVTNTLPTVFATDADRFPTRHGSPGSCIGSRAVNAPQRMIEFRNGGVEFKFTVEPPAEDTATVGM